MSVTAAVTIEPSNKSDATKKTTPLFQTSSQPRSNKVAPAVLSQNHQIMTRKDSTVTITDLRKSKQMAKVEFNRKLREIELKSYRDELAFHRGLLLFLAYAMAGVFTGLSLWVVCVVGCECVRLVSGYEAGEWIRG